MPLSYEDLTNQLKAKKYSPVYLIHGEEPYFIDKITNYFENNVLNEAEQSFNQQVFYGKDIDNLSSVFTACQQYPFMADKRVVIIKEAQNIKDIKPLEKYLPIAIATTILVLVYKGGKFDTRTKVYKGLEKYGCIFEAKKIEPKFIESWLKNECKNQGLNITPNGISLLSSYLGNNIENLINAIIKIKLNIGEGLVDERVVLDNVEISKKFNVFELTDALGTKDKVKVTQIVNYMARYSKEQPIQQIIGMLNSYFSKLTSLYFSYVGYDQKDITKEFKEEVFSELGLKNSFYLEKDIKAAKLYNTRLLKIMSVLLEYDGYSKGINANQYKDGVLLKELVYKILND